jgi:hypothetical protein
MTAMQSELTEQAKKLSISDRILLVEEFGTQLPKRIRLSS